MPVQLTNGPFSSHMPPFQPTLEEELETTPEPQHGVEIVSQRNLQAESTPSQNLFERTKPQAPPPHFASLHLQRDSASTTASDSTSSSPTTTVSLAESYNNTETPVTSPDTPASTQSLSSPSFTLAGTSQISEKPEQFRLAPAPRSLSRPSTSHKKPRNLKNLAVDTSSATAFGRAVNTASLPIQRCKDSSMLSSPVSPPFVKPPKQPKRKGSTLGLSLVTPPSNSPPVQQVLEVPPTPSLVKPQVLRHYPSSPSLPLASPSAPPEGGMRLPPLANRRNVNVGFADAPQEKDEEEPNFDIPQSAEPKPKSYPDGPICIYDPHVYLYYEPNAEQASEFDVVLNVASEVRNPFIVQESAEPKEGESLVSTSEKSSPTTPKAIHPLGISGLRQPDYIHVPWEHNTDIVPDLYDLVKLVDERVQEGKRVLIHCQCGVSRSASLIVAYGLYKNPSMTVQEAYEAVKRRSKWICPNMNLIMQLQEFRSELFKQSAGMPSRSISHRHQTSRSNIGSLAPGRTAKSPNGTQDRPSKSEGAGPRSAPLPPDVEKAQALSITTSRDAVTPGPSSAPSGFAWPIDQTSTPLAVDTPMPPRKNSLPGSSLSSPPLSFFAANDVSSPSSQVSVASSQPSQSTQPSSQASPEQAHPSLQSLSSSEPTQTRSLPTLQTINISTNHISRFHASQGGLDQQADSPRSTEFAMNPAKPPTPDDTFGLTSPRVTNFQSLHTSLHPSPPQPAQSAQVGNEDCTLHTTRAPLRASPKAKPIMPPSNLASLAGFPQLSPERSSHEAQPSLDSLTSPRSSEFAMSGIGPPRALQNDDSFGLSSPRENLTFAQQLQIPYRNDVSPPPAPFSKRHAAFAGLHAPPSSIHQSQTQLSTVDNERRTKDNGARDRRQLRSSLGMSTSSSYDMRSEYILAAKARELISRPLSHVHHEHRDSFVQATQDDTADALMSPRATEFTRNPFADALGLNVDEEPQSSVTGGERTSSEEQRDPRSPVQKAGSSPIVRNIADVFS